MPSTIVTDMAICDKTVKVTVSAREDGDFDVKIESDCSAIRHYAESLTRLTMDDILCFQESRINRDEVRGNMSLICLAPIAVYQAAWMEAGMLSRNNYAKNGPVTMDIPRGRPISPSPRPRPTAQAAL